MIVVLVIVCGFLLMAIIGYFLGPQGNQRPATKRDREIMERRAAGDTPRQRQEILQARRLAVTTVEKARKLRQNGVHENDALAQSLREMVKDPYRLAANQSTKRLYALTISVLMKEGVLVDKRDETLRSHGLTPEQAIHEPELLVEAIGVRSLDAWPPA